MKRKADFLIGVSIFVFVLTFFYGPRTAPTVLFERDSAEFQVLGYSLGIPHGTGYPVYIWLLKLFSFVPIGDIAYRANLFSALCGAFAAALLFWACTLALDPEIPPATRRWSAATAAVAAAFTYTLWSQAIRAEVYTLHAAFSLAILCLVLKWWRDGRFRFLALAALLFCLGLGHHRQIVSMIPPILLLLAIGDRSRFNARKLAALAAIVTVGVCIDIFLFYLLWMRDVSFDQFHRNVLGAADLQGMDPRRLQQFWPAFWFQTSGRQFSSMMFSATPADQARQLGLFLFRILSEYFLIGTVLTVTGFVFAWKEWRVQLFLCAWAATQFFIVLNYTTLGVEVYYISIYLVCGIWFAQGLSYLLRALDSTNIRRRQNLLYGIVCAFLLVCNCYSAEWLPAKVVRWYPRDGNYLAVAAGTRPSLKGMYRALDAGREFVSFVPSNSLVYGPWQMQYVVEYVARLERHVTTLEYYERTPLSASSLNFSRLYLTSIERQVRSRPVYFIGVPPAEVLERYKVQDLGRSLYRVYSR